MSVTYTNNFLAFKRDLNKLKNKADVGKHLDKDTSINFTMNTENRERLILSVMPMVESLARHYANSTPSRVEFEDLLQAGSYGAIVAADRWLNTSIDVRVTKNAKFSTMCHSWILKYIKAYLSDTISILSHGTTKSYDAAKLSVMSGDSPMSNGDTENTTTLFEMISNANTVEEAEIKEQLTFLSEVSKTMFSALTPKEKRIIFAYFGIDRERQLHLDEIAVQLKISKSATFLIVNECIRKMTEKVKSEELFNYAAFMLGADLSTLEEWKSNF